jgi:23S rRNA (pseudouridine1915-N3)-methyltransferase
MRARILIVAVGRLSADMRPAFDHYRRLLTARAELTVREVQETALRGRAPHEVVRLEGKRLSAALAGERQVVALDAGGRMYDSPAFAEQLTAWLAGGQLTFVIGGSLGLAGSIREAAQARLSLSAFTLPHQLARIVLAEQLFRGLKITARETYHH